MKGKIKEDVFTSDGALYKGDVVIVNMIDQLSNIYQVETKLGKLFTVKQSKVELIKNEK
jgi:hypothetical protein|tara:strand:- start:74 stop:250 length:177 start_codon:yes stop_codon:yes gene_type:complete